MLCQKKKSLDLPFTTAGVSKKDPMYRLYMKLKDQQEKSW